MEKLKMLKESNKLAFTLIEILVVIVVLAAILTIAYPTFSNVILNSGNRAFASAEELLVKGVELYVSDNLDVLPKYEGDSKRIYMQPVVDNEYMQEILDPRDGTICTPGSYVDILKTEAGYKYTPGLICTNYQSDEVNLKEYMTSIEEQILEAYINGGYTGNVNVVEDMNFNVVDPITKNPCELSIVTNTGEPEVGLVCDSYITMETFDMLASVGHFKQDSNKDGLADGTYVMEVATPDITDESYYDGSSQQVLMDGTYYESKIGLKSENFINGSIYYLAGHAKLKDIEYVKSYGIILRTDGLDGIELTLRNVEYDEEELKEQTWTRMSGRFESEGNQDNIYVGLIIVYDDTVKPDQVAQFDEISLINLTEIYGSGNEPSLKTIDSIVQASL